MTLLREKNEVQSKCEGFEKLFLKFSNGQENFDKLPNSQRMSFNKEEIGDSPFNKDKAHKNFFLNRHLKTNLMLNAIIV